MEKLGFSLKKQQGFIDHKNYSEQDFAHFSDDTPLLMTEKDAVKCAGFAKSNWWYLPVDASFSADEQLNIENIFKTINLKVKTKT